MRSRVEDGVLQTLGRQFDDSHHAYKKSATADHLEGDRNSLLVATNEHCHGSLRL